MAYREISVLQTREILRRWMAGESARSIHRNIGIDRRTVQRYIDAAELEGLARKSHASALTDELIAAVKARIRPGNPRPEKGAARRLCEQHRAYMAELLADDVRVTRIRVLPARKKSTEVPYRTLARFVRQELRPPPEPTVRLDDPPPGREMQVDFGKMGRVGAAVDEVCRRALEFDVVDVFPIARMLEKAVDTQPPPDGPPPVAAVLRPRFARPGDHFATRRGDDDE